MSGGVDVLLVDDDEDVVRALSTRLRAAGLSVASARTGEEALERIAASRPEVVVADVRMPGMSGFGLCRRVRALGHDELPFLFCSVLGSPRARLLGLRLGADDYVAKPAAPEEIVLRVRSLLDRSRRLRALQAMAEERATAGAVLNGSLADIAVADVFQVLDFVGLEDVCLHLDRIGGGVGQVWMVARRVVHAEAGVRPSGGPASAAREEDLTGRKAFFRMLSWREGTFRVDKQSFTGTPSMSERVEPCILEGLRRLDECRRLRAGLAAAGRYLEVRRFPAAGLEADAAQVVTLVGSLHDLEAVLDRSPLDDLETLRLVAQQVAAGVLAPRSVRRGEDRPEAPLTEAR